MIAVFFVLYNFYDLRIYFLICTSKHMYLHGINYYIFNFLPSNNDFLMMFASFIFVCHIFTAKFYPIKPFSCNS
jgi:hypothetical protein